MRTPFFAGEQLRVHRFGGDDFQIRPRGFQHFAGAGDGAARAVAADEVIKAFAGEVAQDFSSGGFAVILRVGGIFKLIGEEPAIFFGEFFGDAHHAHPAFGSRGQDDFAAKAADEFAPLNGEGFGHHGDKRIAFGGADHGKRDTGVAGGGFNHGLPRFQHAAPLGVVDDGVGEAVFDGAAGVARFSLDVELNVFRRKTVDADNRGVADGIEYGVVFHGYSCGVYECGA